MKNKFIQSTIILMIGGILTKLFMIVILSLLKIGIYSLIFAEIVFIFIVVILDYFKIKKILK